MNQNRRNVQNQVLIGLGSNIQPEIHIEKAISSIQKKFQLLARSNIIETEPVGYKDQPNFLNGVVLVKTGMNYTSFHRWLRNLEKKLGRVRNSNKYGPRTIDLDILVWNGEIIDHDVYQRGFLYHAVEEVWPSILSQF